MIWFEAEQILTYLHGLESKLDDWSLSTVDMRIEKAELERLHRRLVRQKPENAMKAEYLSQLSGRIKSLQPSLEESLKR
jgi:hypothetical protein